MTDTRIPSSICGSHERIAMPVPHAPTVPRRPPNRGHSRFAPATSTKPSRTRQRQMTAEFKQEYARRAGVEGTISQAVRTAGLRRSRYIGLAKTHLQNLITAAALNVLRVAAWLAERPHAPTRLSPFAALARGST